MKTKIVITSSVILSFVLGVVVSHVLLEDKIKENHEMLEKMLSVTNDYASQLESFRKIERLKIDLEALKSLVGSDRAGKHIGATIVDFADRLKKQVKKLEKDIGSIKDPKDIKHAESILEESKKYLDDIEFTYS